MIGSLKALLAGMRRHVGQHDTPATASGELRLVWPTEEQAADGLRRLRECEAAWKGVPALLTMKPDLFAIVSFRETVTNEQGFRLVVDVEDPLLVPEAGKHQQSIDLSCVWNQPYLSFDASGVYAPYCFRLEFGHEAISRVRRFWAALPADKNRLKDTLPSSFGYCFLIGKPHGPTEEDFEKWLGIVARIR